MYIMTEDGWKQLSPRNSIPPKHVPTLLETLNIDPKRDYVKDMIAHCNAKGYYFDYHPDGTTTPREH